MPNTGQFLAKAEKDLQEVDRVHKANASDVFSQDTVIVTLPDVILLDQEWNAVLQGQASLYIFYALSYQDDAIKHKSYWHTTFCAWFTYKQTFYHNCGPNHMERLTGPLI